MGRKRTRFLNLPTRMKARVRPSGTYFYYFTGQKEIALGQDYVQAVLKWGELEGGAHKVASTIRFKWTAEQYFKSEKFKKLAPRTQSDYLKDAAKLYKYFDDPPAALDAIESHHIALYRDWRKVTHSTQELALFSAIWAWAKERGYTNKVNPAQGVNRNKGKGRGDVDISEEMFDAVYAKADQPTKDAMDLAFLAAQRPGDGLKFRESDIKDGALWVRQNKTGKKVRVQIIGELAKVIDRIHARKAECIKDARHRVISLNLAVNEKGQALTYSALDGRFGKAREAAGIKPQDFQFRDLRSKAATEVDEQSGIGAAQGLLGHATPAMTAHYIRNRKGKLVNPTR